MAKQLSFNDLVPTQKAYFDVPDVGCETNAGQISTTYSENFGKTASGATKAIQTDFSKALDDAMNAGVWYWPRPTARKNGSVAGFSRDIVDMGNLLRSKVVTATSLKGGAASKITFSYNSPYAAFVHNGGAIQPYGNPKAATVILPGRPWIDVALNGGNGIPAFDLKGRLKSAYKTGFG